MHLDLQVFETQHEIVSCFWRKAVNGHVTHEDSVITEASNSDWNWKHSGMDLDCLVLEHACCLQGSMVVTLVTAFHRHHRKIGSARTRLRAWATKARLEKMYGWTDEEMTEVGGGKEKDKRECWRQGEWKRKKDGIQSSREAPTREGIEGRGKVGGEMTDRGRKRGWREAQRNERPLGAGVNAQVANAAAASAVAEAEEATAQTASSPAAAAARWGSGTAYGLLIYGPTL